MPGLLTRKNFIKLSAGAAAFLASGSLPLFGGLGKEDRTLRLGGPLFTKYNDPGEWIDALNQKGHTAAYCPVDPSASSEQIQAYKKAASKADIVIAEVGVWVNTISPDEQERKAAIEKCIEGLQLADEIGARCCVNTSGSRNKEYWSGPHKDNLTRDTFNLVVETTRRIIDKVNPRNTFFTLEAMPWAFPYSPGNYLDLIIAIDRKQFGVHLDPVNMIISPQVYFRNGEMIKECFSKLGPYIRSCHAKDIIIREDIFTTHLDEVRPGLGTLDYAIFLQELSNLDNVPLMMEHLQTDEEYSLAAEYIRTTGKNIGIEI
jgi:sugar phosphate isomerase/epimerase